MFMRGSPVSTARLRRRNGCGRFYAIGSVCPGNSGRCRLIKALARYPEAVETAGTLMEPHRITYYLMTLAAAFHTYYNRHRVLCVDDLKLTRARLYLISAVQKVIRNGLALLGVSAPDSM
jgi:arginyl-tRNA synthetase